MNRTTCNAAAGQAPRSPSGKDGSRALHLIDIENLAGGPAALRADATVGDRYRDVVPTSPTDVLTVGTDITNVFAAVDQFPGAGRRAGRGPSGADLALMDAADPDWVAGRFGTVVIASGDGDFALYARACRRAGLRVVVVAHPARLSRALASVADEVVDFTGDEPGRAPGGCAPQPAPGSAAAEEAA